MLFSIEFDFDVSVSQLLLLVRGWEVAPSDLPVATRLDEEASGLDVVSLESALTNARNQNDKIGKLSKTSE